MGLTGRVDAFQRRHRWAAVPVAVIYKFLDDQGTYLAALLAYYGFISLFPLLLLGVTVLGFLLHDDPVAQQAVVSSALRNVPVIGDQIRDNVHSLGGSVTGLVVGVVVAVYGALGVTHAAQHALDEVWAVPKAERAGIGAAYGKGVLIVLLVGAGILLTAGLSAIGTTAGAITGLGAITRGAVTVAGTVVNVGLFLLAYHLLTARPNRLRDRWVAAVAAGITWQVLLSIGTWLVGTRLQGASAMYGLFGIVLGLLGWLYLAALVFVLCAELDAVLALRLHPRSLLSMYPDDRDTTAADHQAYAAYAESERQKDFQSVDVTFTEDESR
ncbi:YihY/virulence factor BrkB family protein [Actinomycetospora cinnamomea]|uniref:YihY family inner membrane protein n=1 Tax=Actinomycetospora cinnamomea TaxID=663609 RepID=A0A2U1F688_9PSEU|nr:YihY/virulence factor BrkB family protein [Actinomycetospora cinnamomea]PVZ07691.1 YihY family inner membrane protein [Actinomycetospora cinnamomea]